MSAASPSPSRWTQVLSELLRRTQHAQGDELLDVVNVLLAPLGLRMRCYLVDVEQSRLRPMPLADAPLGPPMDVEGTVAGRCFATLSAVLVRSDTGQDSLWLPLLDGTERLGVLEIEGAGLHELEVQQRCQDIGILIAHLVAVGMRYGDVLHLVRRTRPMSVGSELLEAMLPPLTYTAGRIAVSCILQPFYEMSGDAFDYAVDGAYANFCLIDAIGHGLDSTLMAAAAVSALRTARRDNESLHAMGRAVDEVLDRQFGHSAFVTAVLARLNLESGNLRYINAGHLPPLLFRHNKTVGELTGGHRLPLGLYDSQIEVAEQTLERGDNLLLYSDGVVEARDAHDEMFGVDRLADIVARTLSTALPAAELMRAVARAVIDFSGGNLRDDATLMLVQWTHNAPSRMTPKLPASS